MRRTEQPNVTTWADAFGIWHARVQYDPMGAAQVAIWREIEARQGPAPIPAVLEIEPGHWIEDPEAPERPRLAALLAEAAPWEA